MRFLDTNITLRYLTHDDDAKAEACYRLFQRVERSEEELFTCEAVVAEVACVLSSPRAPYPIEQRGDQGPAPANLDTARRKVASETALPQSPGYLRVLPLSGL